MLGNFTFYWILQSSSYLVTRLLREDTALTAIMVLLVSRRQRQLLSRLEKVSRKSTAQVNRKKTSRKRCSRRLLPAEKEHLRRTRAHNRRALEEAINAAHETMWELAEAMFGGTELGGEVSVVEGTWEDIGSLEACVPPLGG